MKSRSRSTLTLLFLVLLVAVMLPAHTLAVDSGAQRVLIRYDTTQRSAFTQTVEAAGGQVHHVFDELGVIAATLPSSAVGMVMYFAYPLVSPYDYASNPIAVEIVP